MAKRTAKKTPPPATKQSPPEADGRGAFEKLGEKIDAIPEVQAAEEAVAAARAELEKAQEFCENIRQQAHERANELRDKNLGDLVDAGLAAVKKHPAAGVTLAFTAGVFLGRLFRR